MKLKITFLSEEKIEAKSILNAEKAEKLLKKGLIKSTGARFQSVSKWKREEKVFLTRDFKELEEETELVKKLYGLIEELHNLANIEYQYFKHHFRE